MDGLNDIAQALRKRDNMDSLNDIIARYSNKEVKTPSHHVHIDLKAKPDLRLKSGLKEKANGLGADDLLTIEAAYIRACRKFVGDQPRSAQEHAAMIAVEAIIHWKPVKRPFYLGVYAQKTKFRQRVNRGDLHSLGFLSVAVRFIPDADCEWVLSSVNEEAPKSFEEFPDEPALPSVRLCPEQYNLIPPDTENFLLQQYVTLCSQLITAAAGLDKEDCYFIGEVERALVFPFGNEHRKRCEFHEKVAAGDDKARQLVVMAIRHSHQPSMMHHLARLQAPNKQPSFLKEWVVARLQVPNKQPSFLNEWHTLARKLKAGDGAVSAQDVAAMLEAVPENLRPDWSVANLVHTTAIEVWRNYHNHYTETSLPPVTSAFLRRIESHIGIEDPTSFRTNLRRKMGELMKAHGFIHLCLDELPEVKVACVMEACNNLDKDGGKKHLTQAVICGLLPKEALK